MRILKILEHTNIIITKMESVHKGSCWVLIKRGPNMSISDTIDIVCKGLPTCPECLNQPNKVTDIIKSMEVNYQ